MKRLGRKPLTERDEDTSSRLCLRAVIGLVDANGRLGKVTGETGDDRASALEDRSIEHHLSSTGSLDAYLLSEM
jgi:hypothetical protein